MPAEHQRLTGAGLPDAPAQKLSNLLTAALIFGIVTGIICQQMLSRLPRH